VGFGDTGKAVSFIAFGFFTGTGFGFLLAFFFLVLGGTATYLVHLAVVLTEVAVDPALISVGELGHLLAVLIHRVCPHLCPVCLDLG
jgi:hypothetical protein